MDEKINLGEASQIIDKIEEILLNLIEEKLIKNGKRWDEVIPPEMLRTIEYRKKHSMERPPWLKQASKENKDYISLGYLSKIIDKYWEDAFLELFKSKHLIISKLEEIGQIRNDLFHHKKINEIELDLIKTYLKVFESALNCKPKEIPSKKESKGKPNKTIERIKRLIKIKNEEGWEDPYEEVIDILKLEIKVLFGKEVSRKLIEGFLDSYIEDIFHEYSDIQMGNVFRESFEVLEFILEKDELIERLLEEFFEKFAPKIY